MMPLIAAHPTASYIQRVLAERRAVQLLRDMCLGPREAEKNETELLRTHELAGSGLR